MGQLGYKVNGILLPTPDADADYTKEDMHGKSWRDGSGKMHLVILRRGVISTKLKWSTLTKKQFDLIENACRKDMTGVYTFEDITGGKRTIYTGANLTYRLHLVNKQGEPIYKDVGLSFIEM